MSNFLGFESFLVALGASIEDAKNTIKNALSSRSWQIINENLAFTSHVYSVGWTNPLDAWNNGMSTSAYCTTTALPQYLGVQVVAGFVPTKLHMHADYGTANFTPKNWTVDWSDDGTNWTTLQAFTNETDWFTREKRTYTLSGATSHPYWRVNVTANNGGVTTALTNLIFEDAAGRQVFSGTINPFIFVIPPATETIGNADSFEALRIDFASTGIGFHGLKRYKKGFAQTVFVTNSTAGAVTLSVTINGKTVSYTGIAGNGSGDNLVGLYNAIRDSVDTEITAWNWELSYPAPQNANDGYGYIIGERKTIDTTKAVSAVTAAISSSPSVRPGWNQDNDVERSGDTITIDLVSGFVYYLQVCSRGIALASKTNAGYYGPIHACWIDNAAALAYMPTDKQYCTPLELVRGIDDDANNCDSWASFCHPWIIPSTCSAGSDIYTNWYLASVNRVLRRHRFMDAITTNYSMMNNGGNTAVQLYGSGLFVDDNSVGNDFQIHRVKTNGHAAWLVTNTYNGYHQCVIPGAEISDWYKFRGTATNESLVLIADTVSKGALASNFSIGDTVLNLVDASMLQSSGYVIIGNESLQYTGKSGNQLTGVTGGKYGSIATRHFTGDSANQGLWLVIINGGALLAGYNKPS